jgi:hypothetical protein
MKVQKKQISDLVYHWESLLHIMRCLEIVGIPYTATNTVDEKGKSCYRIEYEGYELASDDDSLEAEALRKAMNFSDEPDPGNE